jgi:hypothetical protein
MFYFQFSCDLYHIQVYVCVWVLGKWNETSTVHFSANRWSNARATATQLLTFEQTFEVRVSRKT